MTSKLKVPKYFVLFYKNQNLMRFSFSIIAGFLFWFLLLLSACQESSEVKEAVVHQEEAEIKSPLFALLNEGPTDSLIGEKISDGVFDTTLFFQQKKGMTLSGNIFRQQADGFWTIKGFDPDIMRKGNFTNGVKTGVWASYTGHDSSSAILFFENFLPQHQYQKYSADSTLLAQGNFKKNQKDGYWKAYYNNGVLKEEGPYCLNMRCGWWKFYNTDGQIVEECNFVNNEKMGLIKIYVNGKIAESGNISEGKRVGEWLYYEESGEAKQREVDE